MERKRGNGCRLLLKGSGWAQEQCSAWEKLSVTGISPQGRGELPSVGHFWDSDGECWASLSRLLLPRKVGPHNP